MPDLDVPFTPVQPVSTEIDIETPSEETPSVQPRRSSRMRFLVAFLVGLIGAFGLGAGGLYAYDRQFAGRILPGVRVGTVDLSGLWPDEARAALDAAYSSLTEGEVRLTTPVGSRTISYADLGRRLDTDSLVAEALAAGRADGIIDRAVSNTRTAIRGVTIEPRVAVDAEAVERSVARLGATVWRAPVDASIEVTKDGFAMEYGADGRKLVSQLPASAMAALQDLAAPARLEFPLQVRSVEPAVTSLEALQAREAAQQMARDIALRHGDEAWLIRGAAIRSWISFSTTADGGYEAVIDETRIPGTLQGIARKIARPARDASFLVGRNGRVVGVTAAHNGRRLDPTATATRLADVLRSRATGVLVASAQPVLTISNPGLTTDEAQKSAPLMKRISRWKTYFPIGIKNGYGANIWIPARLINGYVVAPGATFDFWRAVGPVTRAKGYRDGGAIINGRTEPQGALAGGICSCSTTLFNAALRAGFEMRARRNHYYYIDRYPLGLDATVFISAGGSVQSMSWRNDTRHPVLIRGINTRNGSAGYVTFEIYSVPTGRTVVIGNPTVRNVRYASDTIQYTSSLPPGRSERVEYPVNGMQVWRTVSVYEKGKLLRRVTYYSNYARITGITLIGRARAD